jgi:hypothetical protein
MSFLYFFERKKPRQACEDYCLVNYNRTHDSSVAETKAETVLII